MATLTRVRNPFRATVDQEPLIDTRVPDPFPVVALRITEDQDEAEILRELDREALVLETQAEEVTAEAPSDEQAAAEPAKVRDIVLDFQELLAQLCS